MSGERFAAILDNLRGTYTPEGVGLWLFGAKKSLGGKSPVELLREGRIEEVEQAAERLNGMVGA